MNKILISADAIAKIFEANPQVEIDLMRNAVPEIASRLAKKVDAEIAEIEKQILGVAPQVKQAVDEQLKRVGLGGWSAINEGTKAAIRNFLAEECTREAKLLFVAEGRKALEAEVKRLSTAAGQALQLEVDKAYDKLLAREQGMKDAMDEYAKTAAEREVMALLRAGKLTVAS